MIALVLCEIAIAEDGLLDQARFYVKKQFWDDAVTELDRVTATLEGRIDPEAWFLLAQARYQLGDLEGAQQAAQRSHSYARTDGQLQAAAGFESFLTEQFGVVLVKAPYDGLVGTLDVELTSTLFDPEQKVWLARVEKRIAGKQTLPVRVGLPLGTYKINGRDVEVIPGKTIEVVLGPGELSTGVTQLARAEVAVGIGAWLGADVEGLLPAIETQLALSQPAGPLIFGLMVDWSPRALVDISDAIVPVTQGFSAGIRVGVEARGPALVFRPSVGYRYARIPGVARGCVTGADDVFGCREGTDGADLVVYPIGGAHVPLVELALDWSDRSRKSALGLGVKGIAEHAFGQLPTEGDAVDSRGVSFSWQLDPKERTFSATGFRFLLHVSMGF